MALAEVVGHDDDDIGPGGMGEGGEQEEDEQSDGGYDGKVGRLFRIGIGDGVSYEGGMSAALENMTGGVVTLDAAAMEEGLEASRTSPRKRMILPVHRSQDARVQRMANFMQPGTYIQPHRHSMPHASESVCLLRGRLEVLEFSPEGEILNRWLLSEEGVRMIDIEPGVWHGMIVREEDTVVFECKQGPYDPTADKEFAAWAPGEGEDGVGAFLRKISG
ncbi:MAG: WbuC family cupin fold metalloprotein [Verrucomicrobiaceae bacterium]